MITRQELDRAKEMYERVKKDPYKKLDIDLNLLKIMIDTIEKLYNEKEASWRKMQNKS